MPERILKEIQNIESVELVAICSDNGDIGFKSGNMIPDADISQIAILLLRIFAAQKTQGNKLLSMEFYWQNHFLTARFADGFLIITVCSSSKVLALLRITLNVTVANLLEKKNFLKWLKKHRQDPMKQLRRGSFDDLEIGLISRLG
jgi:hypothetical protein